MQCETWCTMGKSPYNGTVVTSGETGQWVCSQDGTAQGAKVWRDKEY